MPLKTSNASSWRPVDIKNLGDSGNKKSNAATKNEGSDITSKKIRHELYTNPFVSPPISGIENILLKTVIKIVEVAMQVEADNRYVHRYVTVK